jgi:hypothetical protein
MPPDPETGPENGRNRLRRFPRYGPGSAFVLAVVGCALAFTLFQLTRRARFILDLEFSAPAPSQVQVSYNMGAGFGGQRSPAAALQGGPRDFQIVAFELPKGKLLAVRLEFVPPVVAPLLRRAEIRGARGVLAPLSVAGSDGSAMILKPPEPFDYSRVKAVQRIPVILAGNAFLIALAWVIYAIRRPLPKLWQSVRRLVRRANAKIEPGAQRLSAPGFIRFDAPAIWFYVACLAAFAIGSLANLNGSSVGVFASDFHYGPPPKTLLGAPRGIRADEWAYHTPDILNQALRQDRFAFERTALGGHAISLVGNVPIRHVSTLFRPQFWGFFLLPADRAYAVYWQFKALLLLAGVFTWLLLVTGSSFWSAVGALWYFFSPFTQWTYSWTSLLPEMVGLACLIMVLVCFLTVGRNRIALCAASLGAAACAINFVLCGYPPHLIPLCWLMAIFVAYWCVAHREAIVRPEGRGRRALAILAAVLIVSAVGLWVFADLRPAIVAEAHTIYPSQRTLPGGANLSPKTILTHFLQWTEAEHRYPASMIDICEAAGFLWLAPFTLFWFLRAGLDRTERLMAGSLWFVFLFLGAWTVLPLPSFLGMPFGLDRTFSTRILPALGLANIAIVAFFMASPRLPVGPRESPPGTVFRGLQVLVPFGLLLYTVNRLNGNYFSAAEVAFNVCLGAAAILFLLERRKMALAAMLIVSHVLLFGAVNPVERGLETLTGSPLARFVRGHPDVLTGEWMVFGDAPGTSGFLSATGCQVYTGLAYLPDIDHFPMFASAGLDLNVLNRTGYRTARLIGADTGSWVELLDVGFVRWHVSPFDPLVRKLGIRYFAFAEQPPDEVASKLTPLSAGPVGTLWLYRAD